MATPPNKAAGIRRDCRDPTGTDEHTLNVWKTQKIELPYLHIGLLTRYRPENVATLICRNTMRPESVRRGIQYKYNMPDSENKNGPSLEALELLTSRAPDRVQNCHLLTTDQQRNKSR